MTRIEALAKAQDIHEQHKFIKLIAEIYDYFEAETKRRDKDEGELLMISYMQGLDRGRGR